MKGFTNFAKTLRRERLSGDEKNESTEEVKQLLIKPRKPVGFEGPSHCMDDFRISGKGIYIIQA